MTRRGRRNAPEARSAKRQERWRLAGWLSGVSPLMWVTGPSLESCRAGGGTLRLRSGQAPAGPAGETPALRGYARRSDVTTLSLSSTFSNSDSRLPSRYSCAISSNNCSTPAR